MRKLSENEAFQEERQKLKDLKGRKKIQYIWDYYKIPIVAILFITIGVISYIRTLVSEKEPVLFTTVVDMEYDEALAKKLDTDFVADYLRLNASRQEVFLSTNTYLTEEEAYEMNYQYAMAMQTRLVADLSAHRLDVALMDQKGLEGFAHEGYLIDLDTFLPDQDAALYSEIRDCLIKAEVLISDNSEEILLNPDLEYESVTEEQTVGIDVSDWAIFAGENVPSPLYLGVIDNTTREETVLEYLHYLMEYQR